MLTFSLLDSWVELVKTQKGFQILAKANVVEQLSIRCNFVFRGIVYSCVEMYSYTCKRL